MAKRKSLVNAQTDLSVTEFIESIENHTRKADCKVVVKMMFQITGEEPKLWGKSIIGFGKHNYKRRNGDEFESFQVG
jgi:hypothetical protein